MIPKEIIDKVTLFLDNELGYSIGCSVILFNNDPDTPLGSFHHTTNATDGDVIGVMEAVLSMLKNKTL